MEQTNTQPQPQRPQRRTRIEHGFRFFRGWTDSTRYLTIGLVICAMALVGVATYITY